MKNKKFKNKIILMVGLLVASVVTVHAAELNYKYVNNNEFSANLDAQSNQYIKEQLSSLKTGDLEINYKAGQFNIFANTNLFDLTKKGKSAFTIIDFTPTNFSKYRDEYQQDPNLVVDRIIKSSGIIRIFINVPEMFKAFDQACIVNKNYQFNPSADQDTKQLINFLNNDRYILCDVIHRTAKKLR